MLIEEKRTRNNFLSCGYLLHCGVVGTAKTLRWASLLALLLGSHRSWSTRCVGLPWQATLLGEVPNLPTVVAWVPHWRDLLWWSSCCLLLLEL
jgi:hypothetical protein